MENILIDLREKNKWIRKVFENKDLVSLEELFGKIENMNSEIEDLKSQVQELKRDIEENYEAKPIDLGLSEREFY